MAAVVALLLALLAVPASAGELVRYRTADGAVGFVDDERRLPPGAIVVSRMPLTESPAAPPLAAAEPPGPAPASEGEAIAVPDAAADEPRDCAAYTDRSRRLACWSDHGRACSRFGLPLRCAADELAMAESWCARGAALRRERTPLEDRLASATETHRDCESGFRAETACSRENVLEAERAVEVWELRLAALEEQCHEQGCMPGWVRESCEEPTLR